MAFALVSRSQSKTQGLVKPGPKQKSTRGQHSADSGLGFARPGFQPQTVSLPTAPSVSFSSNRGGMLQRKCACGGSVSMSGECEECSKKKRVGLQTKLKVNEPGDIYEQEADRVADQVMATPAHPGVNVAPPRIQRFSEPSNGQMDTAPASVDRVLASPGRPLETATRQDMEQRFGHNFSQVRVHTDATAAQSAREVGALAYTMGSHVVFGAQVYVPQSHRGRSLIAHELTHVLQQRAIGVADGTIRIDNSSQMETQADVMARDVHQPHGSKLQIADLSSLAIQRQPLPEKTGEQENAKKQLLVRLNKVEEAHKYWISELSKERQSVSKDLFSIVQEQGVDIEEDIELVREALPSLVSLSEQERESSIRALEYQVKLFGINIEHLTIMVEEERLQVPDFITNKDEVEELLDDYADKHEYWIDQNALVAEVASDIVQFFAGRTSELPGAVPEPNVEILTIWVAKDVVGEQHKVLRNTVQQLVDIKAAIKTREEYKSIKQVADALEFLEDLPIPGKRRGRRKTKRAKRTKAQREAQRTTRTKRTETRAKDKEKRRKERKERKERRCRRAPGSCPVLQPRLTGQHPYWTLVYEYRKQAKKLERKHFNANFAVLVLDRALPIIESSEQAFHSEQLILWKLEERKRKGKLSGCPILGLFSERKPCTTTCQPDVLPRLCRLNQGVPFPVYYAAEYYDNPKDPRDKMKTKNNPGRVIESYISANYPIRRR
jgi:hypothetical protein